MFSTFGDFMFSRLLSWHQPQVLLLLTAVSCFPLLARVGTEFMFSRSSHTFHVSRAWQQLQVFPRVSTSSPTPAAVSCFPTLITGFIISAGLTGALVYYVAVICLVTQRCCPYSPPKGKEHCRDETSNGFLDTLIRRIGFLWFCFQRALALFILPPVHLLSISRPANLFSSSLLHWFILFYLCNHRYDFLAYTVTLNYQSTLLKTREEISMVVLGPFTNIIIFCLTVIFSWILQRLYGTSPNIFSRFIMAYGINVLLDPIWILIVDSALMRYDALWWPFLKKLSNQRF